MDLSDRMKLYEKTNEASLIPLLPVVARLDGKAFHKFTRDLARPYDERLTRLMVATTKFLVEQVNACIGYTQSDEISLILYSDSFKSEIFMGGRATKLISILASMTTAYFNKVLPGYLPDKKEMAFFDCRVFNVPTKTEAVNCLIWREQDATRNSIQMAGQSVFSHKQLMNKSCDEIQEMLFSKGINWNDYPRFFRRGTYIQRCRVTRKFTSQELEKLPLRHEARSNPDFMVERWEIKEVDLPILSTITNREEVIFNGVEAINTP